jgi:hypothetical protein
MSRWFRLYDEMLDDPKLQRLPPATFKSVINLWCLASKYSGKLPPCADVAFALRVTESDAVTLLDELVTLGLLDHDDDGLRPHGWDKRQYKSDVTDPTAAERMRRYRNAHRNGPVTVTVPRTDTETEAEQKKEETRARRAWPFEEFWALFPAKVGKGAAKKAFEKVRKSNLVEFQDLMEALRRYVVKTDDRPWCHATTWLNQERWTDEPSEVGGGKTQRHSGNQAPSTGSVLGAIEEMRAGLAADKNADVVQFVPARPIPGPEGVHGANRDGSGAVRPAGGGHRNEPTDWHPAGLQISAKYRGTG